MRFEIDLRLDYLQVFEGLLYKRRQVLNFLTFQNQVFYKSPFRIKERIYS